VLLFMTELQTNVTTTDILIRHMKLGLGYKEHIVLPKLMILVSKQNFLDRGVDIQWLF